MTLEEPTECRDCGFVGEAEVFITGIINEAGDVMTWCPACESDYVVFHRPKEDRSKEQ